jgi:hypothetical protein
MAPLKYFICKKNRVKVLTDRKMHRNFTKIC